MMWMISNRWISEPFVVEPYLVDLIELSVRVPSRPVLRYEHPPLVLQQPMTHVSPVIVYLRRFGQLFCLF